MKTHEAIAARRKALRLTQEDVARALGVSKPIVCRIEKGQAGITIDRLEAIANVLQTTPAELLGEQAKADYTLDELGILVLYKSLNEDGKKRMYELFRREAQKEEAEKAIEELGGK